jgi:aspartate aminotransferase-like enzyme
MHAHLHRTTDVGSSTSHLDFFGFGGRLSPLVGKKTIRVGLMGKTATEEMVDRLLELVGEVLAA